VNIREKLQAENPDIDLLFLTDEVYDAAIIGVGKHLCPYTHKEVKAVCYDESKVIEKNLELGLGYDWYDYNQAGAYVGEQTPFYV
jgi:hypothetical protein